MNTNPNQRDHGGNLDAAKEHYGEGDWIDLSTGINRNPWPVPTLPLRAWTDLPTNSDKNRLMQTACKAYGTDAPGLALAGAQAAIQLIPSLRPKGRANILGPTYNEHAAQLQAGGWQVHMVEHLDELAGADLAVVVNPNNPGGQHYSAQQLLAIKEQVSTLVVDESFGDACPELSVAPHADDEKLIVLRSFGKFYGLAGLRLGFLFANKETASNANAMGGPWPVSGVAIAVGYLALSDDAWKARMKRTLRDDVARLDGLANQCGWKLVGGTELFRTYETPNAEQTQNALANTHIWTRVFPWSDGFIRLGIPGNTHEWARLIDALDLYCGNI